MLKCECSESRKNLLDGAWLNPKHLNNCKSAGNNRIGLPPTTRSREDRTHKRVEVFAPKSRKRYG